MPTRRTRDDPSTGHLSRHALSTYPNDTAMPLPLSSRPPTSVLRRDNRNRSRVQRRVRFAPLPEPHRPRRTHPQTRQVSPVQRPNSGIASTSSPRRRAGGTTLPIHYSHLLFCREALTDLRSYLSSACNYNMEGDNNFLLAISALPVNVLYALASYVNALRSSNSEMNMNQSNLNAIENQAKRLRACFGDKGNTRHPHELLEDLDPTNPNIEFTNFFERNARLAHRSRMRRRSEHSLLHFVAQQLKLPAKFLKNLKMDLRERDLKGQRELDAFSQRLRIFNSSSLPFGTVVHDGSGDGPPALRRSRSVGLQRSALIDDNVDDIRMHDDDDRVGGTSSAPQSPADRRAIRPGDMSDVPSPRSAPMGGLREPIGLAHSVPDIVLPKASFDHGSSSNQPANPYPPNIVILSGQQQLLGSLQRPSSYYVPPTQATPLSHPPNFQDTQQYLSNANSSNNSNSHTSNNNHNHNHSGRTPPYPNPLQATQPMQVTPRHRPLQGPQAPPISPYTGPTSFGTAAPPPRRRNLPQGTYPQPFFTSHPPPSTPPQQPVTNSHNNGNGTLRYGRTPPPPPTAGPRIQ